MTPRTTYQLIRRGQFARLWLAGGISSFGDWVSLFATLALGNHLGGTTGVAVPLVARFMPALFFGAISGVVADRFDNRRVMMVADFARAGLVLSLILVDTLSALFLVTIVIEMFSLVRQPAREAAMATIVDQDELMGANSVSVLATYGTVPLAGIIWAIIASLRSVDTWETGFMIDAATFVISGILVLLLALPPRQAIVEREQGDWTLRDAVRDFVEGIRYVGGHHRIRIPVFGMTGAMAGGAALFVLGEPFSHQVLGLGSRGFGVLGASLGLGVAFGVFLARTLEKIAVELESGFSMSLVVAGVGISLVAFTNSLFAAGAGALLAGVGTGGAYVLGFTAIHAEVDDEVRGRTFAALFTLARTAVVLVLPVAPLVAVAVDGLVDGPLGNGLRFSLALSGLIVLIVGGASVLVSILTIRSARGSEV